MRIFEVFSVLIWFASLVSSTYGEKEDMHKRSYTVNPGKILFCPSARAGPPGPPGPPGLPGRDGRDGRDCPPCNCGGGAPAAPLPPVESPCPGPSPLLPQGPSTGGREVPHIHISGQQRDLLGDQVDEESGSGNKE